MLIGNWCIHNLSEDTPLILVRLLLSLDDMVGDGLVHRLDHVVNIRSQVRSKSRHQADAASEDGNVTEDVAGGDENLECTLVVLLEVISVQEPCTYQVM